MRLPIPREHFFRLIQDINRSVIRQSIILIVKLMSFKTSVLIWFSRFRGTQPHPQLTGWGFCIRQKNIGLEDRVTEEHKGNRNMVLDRRTKRHILQ